MSKSRANGGAACSRLRAAASSDTQRGSSKSRGDNVTPSTKRDDERLGLEDAGEDGRSDAGGGGEDGVVVLVVAVDSELSGLADADPDDVIAGIRGYAVVAVGHSARDRFRAPVGRGELRHLIADALQLSVHRPQLLSSVDPSASICDSAARSSRSTTTSA